MARYLVTGGAGFIGSHLVEALLRRGAEVRVLDSFATGRPDNLTGLGLGRGGELDLVEGDLRDRDAVRRAVEGCDSVFHQGAVPSVQRSVEDPAGTHATNVGGTIHVLLAARDAGVRRVVYASSSSVYGDSPTLPKVETMPASPLSPYAVQKLAGELYARIAGPLFGVEAVSLRYFNVFGPRQDPRSEYAAVIPRFATALLRGEAPTVFGDGEQSRDFTYVENVVEANLLALAAPGSAVAGQALNVASGERHTLNELLSILRAKTGRANVEARYEAPRAGDVRHSLADIDRARSLLGYEPRISFAEGVERTVAWYRERV